MSGPKADALASEGTAGEGGFDPGLPVCSTKGGQQVESAISLQEGHIEAFVKASWDFNGKLLTEVGDLDLINTPLPVVAPTPAGDMAGKDDAGRKLPAWAPKMLSAADSEAAVAATRLARESARREPVAGDGWQQAARLREALERICAASPANTNSPSAASMASWCKAVAATALDDIALPSASPNGAGSGSEPVVWQWRRLGDTTWQTAVTNERWARDQAGEGEVRPLYASPAASVDAVAVVTYEDVAEACKAYERWAAGGRIADWYGIKAALRARQQSPGARS